MFRIMSVAACVLLLGWALSSAAATTASNAGAQQLGTLATSEDIVAIPGSRWLIVSTSETFDPGSKGSLAGVDTINGTIRTIFPDDAPAHRPADLTHSGCADRPPARFRPHGITIMRGRGNVHRLYAVNHGERESIEVFRLDVQAGAPTLQWTGCVLAPPNVTGNAVAALADGFVMTHTKLPSPGEGAAWAKRVAAGENVGDIYSWSPTQGWSKVDSGHNVMPNGIEVSRDGKWLFYADSEREKLIRLSLGRQPVQKDEIDLHFHTDNVHWAPDGRLLVAGQTGKLASLTECVLNAVEEACGHAVVARIDPSTLHAERIVDTASYRRCSSAAQVGAHIWLGAIRGTIGKISIVAGTKQPSAR